MKSFLFLFAILVGQILAPKGYGATCQVSLRLNNTFYLTPTPLYYADTKTADTECTRIRDSLRSVCDSVDYLDYDFVASKIVNGNRTSLDIRCNGRPLYYTHKETFSVRSQLTTFFDAVPVSVRKFSSRPTDTFSKAAGLANKYCAYRPNNTKLYIRADLHKLRTGFVGWFDPLTSNTLIYNCFGGLGYLEGTRSELLITTGCSPATCGTYWTAPTQ